MIETATLRGFIRSEPMQVVAQNVQAAIRSRGNVVICGEPGTGRVALARAIHCGTIHGHRALDDLLREAVSRGPLAAPFVLVECGAGRDVDQVLFGRCGIMATGHELEHITRESQLYQAFGGTLVLRSAQELPGRLQARLARILRDGEVWVVGGPDDPALAIVDVRAIAVVDGAWDDGDERIIPELHKRLASHRIPLPPLRQRREDIPALVRCLLADICESLRIPPKSVSRQAMELLSALPWNGNLKEMRGLLRPLALKVPGRLIRLSDVLANIRLGGGAITSSGGGTLKEARERFEREYVTAVLEQHHGRMAEAAQALGIQRTNLYRKVKQLSVDRKRRGQR